VIEPSVSASEASVDISELYHQHLVRVYSYIIRRCGDRLVAAAGALKRFNQLRAGEEPLNDQTGVSADIVAKWERGKLLLADAD
jgi:hypothetical protein